MSKRALICGISGQDGTYLARLLLDKGYAVCGTSRDAQVSPFSGLRALGILDRLQLESMAPTDFRSVLQVLTRFAPDEVYMLAGQSSVALSFQQPAETLESNTLGILNVLEAIRFVGLKARLYNAASSECFGNSGDHPANEDTPFRPRSPYAVAKSASYWAVANYREAYGLWVCSGILSNHESPLRPARFVTRKIVRAAVRIARGAQEKLALGDLSVQRDWGWAPEFVDAMWRMLQQPKPQDLVIATGETNSLEAFVETAFAHVDLDWREHVVLDDSFRRPADITCGRADPRRAADVISWRAQLRMRDVVRAMVDAERQTSQSDRPDW
jgi:GDPmannose 4,6-dehydratase